MRRVARFFSSRANDRLFSLAAAFVLIAVRLAIRVLPFSVVWRLAGKRGRRDEPVQAGRQNLSRRLVSAVRRASRFLPGTTCLAEALAASILLDRFGLPGTLRIGVARGEEGQLVAHAWVESSSKILIGKVPNLGQYTSMSRQLGKEQ